ncbi:hypothetical protein V6N13_044746 [Hibiscus sabdariffa]|uniref:RING-type E3 ubiquitin transferase n=1 Tax=Hibiscus sabdariffa TaxID=183260 RepID=A0ABR2RJ05_9ROSI
MSSQGQDNSSQENPTQRPLLENSETSPNNGQISSNQGTIVLSNSLGQVQGTGSGPSDPIRLDLNEPQLALDLVRTGRSSGNQQNAASGGSSSPITIHSGSAGYVVEENRGFSTHGQSRLLCKRRVAEGTQPQNNIVINIVHAAASSSNNGTPSARTVATPPIPVGQTDNLQRNTRPRTIVSQQNPGPVNVSAWNTSNFNVQQATGHHHQRQAVSPFGTFPRHSSPVLANQTILQQQQPIVGVHNQLQQQPIVGVHNQLQHQPIVGVHNQLQHQPIVGVHNQLQAPLSSQYWNNGTTVPARDYPSFGSSHVVTPSANMNLVNGNQSYLGNVASSSGTQSGVGMYNSALSSVGYHHQPSLAEQNAQRLRHILDRNGAWRMAHNYPIYNESTSTVRDFETTTRNGNHWSTQVPPRSGALAVRQAGNDFVFSRTMTSEMADQRRSRLIAQMRNYLRVVRRTGGLRIEDATDMGRSFLQGMYALEDVHDDMRLDVDNMSHEELLDLEEQMGNVSTGLGEEAILANLRRRRFQPISVVTTAEAEQCCICQEDYADGDELGKLDCGHDFHFNCIKPWLVQKNQCPVCKKTALAI